MKSACHIRTHSPHTHHGYFCLIHFTKNLLRTGGIVNDGFCILSVLLASHLITVQDRLASWRIIFFYYEHFCRNFIGSPKAVAAVLWRLLNSPSTCGKMKHTHL
jgi:hypothetical protein